MKKPISHHKKHGTYGYIYRTVQDSYLSLLHELDSHGTLIQCYFPVCRSLAAISAESGSLREVRLLSEYTQIAVIYSGSRGRGSGRANEHFGTVGRNFNQTLSGEERKRPAADDASHHVFSVERKRE